jgi:cytochrome c6
MKKNLNEKILTALTLALGVGVAVAIASPATENWENSCASCHGMDGKAQTRQGKKLKIRDYSDPKVQAELKDDAMLKAILDGVVEDGKERMKGYRDEYSEEEAKALVKYIRGLKP